MTTNISTIVKPSTIDTIASVLPGTPLVANSPFLGWLYQLFPVYPFSVLLGVFEVTAALLLAIKPVAPKLSIIGSRMAIVLFLNTTSFLFTTPG